MFSRNIHINIKPTIEELAHEFCEMDVNQHADFFNCIGSNIKHWDGGFSFQMQRIVDSKNLNENGRYFLRIIAECINTNNEV